MKKYGVLNISQELLKELLDLPEDWEITDAEYDGFHRCVKLAINGSSDILQFVPEGASIPTIQIKR